MSDSLDLLFKLRAEGAGGVEEEFSKIRREIAKMKEDLKEGIKLGLDTSTAEASIKRLETVLKQFEALKDFQVLVAGASEKLTQFGKEAINVAMEIKGFENGIKNLATSGQQADRIIAKVNDMARSFQEFSINSLFQAANTITKFKLNTEELLPKIADFADVMKKDVSLSANVMARALTGIRGGVGALQMQFGISTEELIKYGAEVNNSGKIIADSGQTIQAVYKILDEYSSKVSNTATDTAESYEDAVTRYENSIVLFKSAIGKELLPIITSGIQKVSDLTAKFSELGESQKSVLKDAVLVGGGITGIGYGVSVAIPAINGLTIAFKALSAAALAFPVATITLAIGAAAMAGIEYWKKLEQQKSEKIVNESKHIEKGFNSLKQAIDEVNKTHVNIVIEGNTEEKLEDIERRIKNTRDLAVSQTGGQAFNIPGQTEEGGMSIATGNFTGVYIRQGEAVSEVYRKVTNILDGINAKREKGIALSKTEEQAEQKALELLKLIDVQLKDTANKQETVIDGLQKSKTSIEDAQKSWGGLFSALDAGFTSTIDGLNKVSQAAKKDTEDRAVIDDKAFKEKLNYYKDDIDHLRSYWTTYQLTYTQQQELTEAITQGKQKQADDEKKIHSQRQQQERETYDTFKKTLDNALAAGRVNNKQYYDLLGKYLTVHAEELKSNSDLKLSIESDYIKASNTLKDEARKKTSEALKKETEEKQAAKEAALAQIEEEKQAEIKAAEEKAEAEKKRLQANKDIQKEIDSYSNEAHEREMALIADKLQAFRDAGAEETKIEELKHKAIQDLQQSTLEDFKQKEEEKRKSIEDTTKAIEDVEAKLAVNQKQKESLQGSSFKSGSPLMTSEEALSGGKSGHMDSYIDRIDQEKALMEEEKKLQDEKTRLISEENELRQGLIKIQADANSATRNFTSALGGATTALNKFSSSGNSSSSNDSGSPMPGKFGSTFSQMTSAEKMEELNRQYAEKSKEFSGDSEKMKILEEYYKYYSGMFGAEATGSAFGYTGSQGFDDPANDAKAFKFGEILNKEVTGRVVKSLQDQASFILAGQVKGLEKDLNNISNVTNNSSQSNSNNYYMSGFNINNAPDNVKRGTQETVSWAMMQKYVRGK